MTAVKAAYLAKHMSALSVWQHWKNDYSNATYNLFTRLEKEQERAAGWQPSWGSAAEGEDTSEGGEVRPGCFELKWKKMKWNGEAAPQMAVTAYRSPSQLSAVLWEHKSPVPVPFYSVFPLAFWKPWLLFTVFLFSLWDLTCCKNAKNKSPSVNAAMVFGDYQFKLSFKTCTFLVQFKCTCWWHHLEGKSGSLQQNSDAQWLMVIITAVIVQTNQTVTMQWMTEVRNQSPLVRKLFFSANVSC